MQRVVISPWGCNERQGVVSKVKAGYWMADDGSWITAAEEMSNF